MKTKDSTAILEHTAEKLQDHMDKTGAQVNLYVGKARMPIVNQFVLLFYRSFHTLIDEYNLTRTEIKAVLKILEYSQFGNLVQLSRKKLAEDLGIDTPFLSRTMKKLKTSGLLIDDGGNLYLNPQIIAKGRFMDSTNNDAIEGLLDKGAAALEQATGLGPSILTKKLKAQNEKQGSLLE